MGVTIIDNVVTHDGRCPHGLVGNAVPFLFCLTPNALSFEAFEVTDKTFQEMAAVEVQQFFATGRKPGQPIRAPYKDGMIVLEIMVATERMTPSNPYAINDVYRALKSAALECSAARNFRRQAEQVEAQQCAGKMHQGLDERGQRVDQASRVNGQG